MITVMEVCGTHTAAAVKYGIRGILPADVRLVSGPGCPVCVTPAGVMDELVEISLADANAVVTFGDLVRVRGTCESLADAKASGGDVRVVYSPFDVLSFAEKEPSRIFTVAAVGFETTAPVYAALIERAAEKGLTNVRLLSALKTMPGAIKLICEAENAPDGFIAPGHVAAVTGAGAFAFIGRDYGKPCVVAGFGARDMLAAIGEIVRQTKAGECVTKNFYPQSVTENGQGAALGLIDKYFEPCDSRWRGIGEIEGSGLKLKDEYEKYKSPRVAARHRASNRQGPESSTGDLSSMCRCRDVMLGVIIPTECRLFGKACTPSSPVGACMVTGEGACGIFYAMGNDSFPATHFH